MTLDNDPLYQKWLAQRIQRSRASSARRAARNAALKPKIGSWDDAQFFNAIQSKMSTNYTWNKNHPILPPRKFVVDIAGHRTNKSASFDLVLIELERKRGVGSIYNVIKAWEYAIKNKQKSIHIIQIFSPAYGQGMWKTRMQQIQFVGNQVQAMHNNFKYTIVDPTNWPSSVSSFGSLISIIVKII